MWKNYLVSALGNLRRNRLYAAINIVGLALGVAAALLIALFVRDELNYDRFQGHRDVYLLTATERFLDHRMRDQRWDFSLPDLAPQLRVELPQAAAIARVMRSRQSPHVRSGRVEADEAGFDWADGALFEIMPQTVLAGDVRTALTTPDAVVLTRSMARKYFGRDTPLGETLEVDPAMGPAAAQISPSFNRPHPMKVAAVIEDLPSNTYLKGELFGSSVTSYSPFALYDQTKDEGPFRGWSTYTFIRLKPNVPLGGVETQLASFALRHIPVYPPGFRVGLQLTPIADVHLSPSGAVEMTPHGDPKLIAAVAAIGCLILLSASINFVTLNTARASRRATETGVRKAVGALRSDLVIQFLLESMIYVFIAMVLAISLTEILLPQMNAVLGRTIAFDYLRDPALAAALLGATPVLGVLAGAYPAFVLSAYTPARVLKGEVFQNASAGWVRQGLVALQFAILIGLGVAAATLWRETLFSLHNQLRQDGSAILLIDGACDQEPAGRAFRERAASVPGVGGAVCVSANAIFNGGMIVSAHADGRPATPMAGAQVDFGALEFFGQRPLAGRFFVPGRGEDSLLLKGDPTAHPSVVLNEEAVRELGLKSPSEAVGKILTWNPRRWSAKPVAGVVGSSEIIGVAPNYTLDTRHKLLPQIIYVDPNALDTLSLRIAGAQIPEALAAIDRAWAETGRGRIRRRFLNQTLEEMYASVSLQSTVISLGAGVALVIAALGLFGLSAHSAEQRTKEIGIRKAMGASSGDIVRLLLVDFSRPVLFANLIAWPAAWWAMSQWLSGFANHVDLPLWLFLASGGLALVIACVTVFAHAILVARATPVTSLRYE